VSNRIRSVVGRMKQLPTCQEFQISERLERSDPIFVEFILRGAHKAKRTQKESPKRKRYLQLIDCWWNNPISIRTTILHGLHSIEPPCVLRVLSQRLLQQYNP